MYKKTLVPSVGCPCFGERRNFCRPESCGRDKYPAPEGCVKDSQGNRLFELTPGYSMHTEIVEATGTLVIRTEVALPVWTVASRN